MSTSFEVTTRDIQDKSIEDINENRPWQEIYLNPKNISGQGQFFTDVHNQYISALPFSVVIFRYLSSKVRYDKMNLFQFTTQFPRINIL